MRKILHGTVLLALGCVFLSSACSSAKEEICDLAESQVSCSDESDCPCDALSCEGGVCMAVLGTPGEESSGTLRSYEGPTTISAESYCNTLKELPCEPAVEKEEKEEAISAENASGSEEAPSNSGGSESGGEGSAPSSTPADPDGESSMPESRPQADDEPVYEIEQPYETEGKEDTAWLDACVGRYSADQFAMDKAGCVTEYDALRDCVMGKLICLEGMDLEVALTAAEKKCGEQVSDLSLCLDGSHCDRSGFYCEEPEFSTVCRPRAQSGCLISEAECEPMNDDLGNRWACTCTQGINRGLAFTTYDSSCCGNAHFLEETCGYGDYYEKPKPSIASVLGQPCKSDNDCGDAICQVSNFSARPFCTVACDLRNEICHTQGGAGGEGTYYEGFRCIEMQGAFEGRIGTFCAPECQDVSDCTQFDTNFDTCANPEYHGIPPAGYVADSYQVCSAPPADPGPPVDPVLCDYQDKVSGPAIIIDVCRSYCSFVETCKYLPDGVSPACCEWGCYLWATPTGSADAERKADLICFTNAFKGNQENSTVCTAPTDTCGEPPVLEP